MGIKYCIIPGWWYTYPSEKYESQGELREVQRVKRFA